MIAPVKYPLGVLPVFPSAEYSMMFSFILVLLNRDGPVRMRYELFRSFFLMCDLIIYIILTLLKVLGIYQPHNSS